MPIPSSGYSGPSHDSFVGTQRWELREWVAPLFHNVTAIVECWEDDNRIVSGYLTFQSREEFEWMKARISGDRRVERKRNDNS